MSKLSKTTTIVLLSLFSWACNGQKSESTDVFTHYLAIKDALVATDAQKVSEAAKSFLEENTNPALKPSLQKIANTTDVSIQRKAFEQLSKDMYHFVTTEGVGTTVYKQYCPMAFDNKGAYWLAKEKQVNNPYFGDAMLHCGSVEEVITKD